MRAALPRAGAPRATVADATLPATAALTGLTLAAALGMGRLFADASYLGPLVVAALVTHGAMWAGRRLAAPLPLSAAVSLAALAVAVAWVVLPDSTAYGLPGAGTLAAARHELVLSWTEFGHVVAPAPVTKGFLIAAMAGVGVTGVLADWAAFRMLTLFEAVIPSFTLFVFTATLGADRHRGLLVAVYLAALLLFLVLHEADLRGGSASWFASRSRGGPASLVQGGAVLGSVAILAAVTIGPKLPGADDPPVIPLRDSDRGGGKARRSTVSPLVDIRGRLVELSESEVFTVRSNLRSYWRLTSLDSFDGSIWSSDDRYRPVDERLPGGVPSRARADRAVQEFRIGGLSSIWLPAAYRPTRIDGVEDVSYNDALGSLISAEDTTDGLTYRVESVVPRPTAGELGQARSRRTQDVERFLRLPPISPRVRRLAQQLAQQGDRSPYAVALALQSYFRQGFTYDLRVRPGHDERALETFLFSTRRGYCEQFAGAYAVLARAVGLPTRVAVGFTAGELGGDGRYHVRGLNAHAWPEVHLEGFGWVAFEPTPGRGAPGAEAYTGLPEAQARPENPSTATTASPGTTAPDAPEPTATTVAPEETGVSTEAPGSRRSALRHPLLLAVVAAVLAVSALAGLVPLAKRARRNRRRAGAATAADRVLVAWAEADEALAQAGAGRRRSETLAEHARRAATAATLPPPAASALTGLAGDAAAAAYGAGLLSEEVASRAMGARALVVSALRAAAPLGRRVRWAIDPRPLVSRAGRRPPPGLGGGAGYRAA